jgi:hypothetical protein
MTDTAAQIGADLDDYERGGQDTTPDQPDTATPESADKPLPVLKFHTLSELCARVDAASPRRWLIRGIWPAGAYGVTAAEMNAGKTWAALDLAVSTASGTAWLGTYPIDDPGPVLVFAGEGGEASIVRRIRAICASRDLKAEDLPITICTRAPHLADVTHRLAFAEQVQLLRPRLVILDPLYLALGGADGKNIYGKGELLEKPQHICEDVGASLVVVTHHNRSGRSGAQRITGAGPAEWGRVLINADVVAKHTDKATRKTTVLLAIDIQGGEVPDLTFRVKRDVWADDPDDLDTPLNYQAAVVNGDANDTAAAEQKMPPARRKLYEAVQALSKFSTQAELVDWIAAKYGHGLKRPTCSTHLNELLKAGLVDRLDHGRDALWAPTQTRHQRQRAL